MALLRARLGTALSLYASQAHLDPSVRTGIPPTTYHETRMVRLAGRFYVQLGGWRPALRAETLITDLNPRSLSNWFFLFSRRLTGRRTLLWGHLHPRAGRDSRTAALRRCMLRTAHGFVAYTPGQAKEARKEHPGMPVWVAANALYTRSQLRSSSSSDERTDVVYVGRLEPEKRVDLLVEAFAQHAARQATTRLVLVGAGESEAALRHRVHQLGLDDRVVFTGWVNEVEVLRRIYDKAFCSTSPGFAGLGLTQSVGFGVPQVVADDQVHSPEIELAAVPGAVLWFSGSSAGSLAGRLDQSYADRQTVPRPDLVAIVREHYSAEAMARGLADAFVERSQIGA